MQAGKLRHRIGVKCPCVEASHDGSIENILLDKGTFYGSLSSLIQSEASVDGKLISFVQYRISLRYNSMDLNQIPPNSQLTVNGQTLHVISSTVLDARSRVIQILAEERL